MRHSIYVFLLLSLVSPFALATTSIPTTIPTTQEGDLPFPPKARCECVAQALNELETHGDNHKATSWCYATSYAKKAALDSCLASHESCEIKSCKRI